jgi:hypothetical protein
MPCQKSPQGLGPPLMAMLSPLADRLRFVFRPLKAAISCTLSSQVPPTFSKTRFPHRQA